MKLITERSLIRTVAERWDSIYGKHTIYSHDPERQEIGKALAALNVETAKAEDVAAIIGNTSWCIYSTCHECAAEVPTVIQVGEEPTYDSATAYLCFQCLEKAYNLMKEELHG